ncbi:hypothetical protein DAPPUDRAFT_111327 [Daphnia pulex]|uniref:Uncharacterized protein n=1 Tax=Daphnia pulex TaxID=6669 RepID=E9H8U5_DAPPU|nr:hypothetical protein DAPPUDRAFT_111327 [Daphnia pulex]|eukprot:EFX71871.1 hypothetical protein DAPPUDRAFT_111327 [Daphnia pulex]
MTYQELVEAQQRHRKILSNKTVLKRLPDKGQKFIETNNKIDERLQEFKVESDGLSEMLSGMTLSACPNVNQMEWIGKVVSENSSPQSSPSNQQKAIPNDESRDIVDILLTTNQMSKIVIDERTPSTVADINAHEQDQCYKRLAEKVEKLKPVNHQFKPFRTLNHEQDPALKQFHKWDENTAATPPTFRYNGGAKTIQIDESLELQVQLEEKRKLMEQERSRLKFSQLSPDAVPIHPEEHHEVYDDEPEGAGGGLTIWVPFEAVADCDNIVGTQ